MIKNYNLVFLEKKVASAKPEIICQIPHHAAMNAIPPNPLKSFGLKINTSASPELCIPDSMVMVFMSETLRRTALAKRKPEEMTMAL